MAKPIRATPSLKKEEAKKFIERMIAKEKRRIPKRDYELAKEIGVRIKEKGK